ncbi:hypothetical protein MJ567_16550 [Escherichia coli]|nr:hypothetical protein MJ567_16550 [Escherichia coli]
MAPGGVTVGHLVPSPGDHAGDAAEHVVAFASAWRRWRSLSGSKCKKGVSDRWGAGEHHQHSGADNPMQFQFSQFLDSALQIVGRFLALMVILIVRG